MNQVGPYDAAQGDVFRLGQQVPALPCRSGEAAEGRRAALSGRAATDGLARGGDNSKKPFDHRSGHEKIRFQSDAETRLQAAITPQAKRPPNRPDAAGPAASGMAHRAAQRDVLAGRRCRASPRRSRSLPTPAAPSPIPPAAAPCPVFAAGCESPPSKPAVAREPGSETRRPGEIWSVPASRAGGTFM